MDMTFGHGSFDNFAASPFAAETHYFAADTSKDVEPDTGKATVNVKWYANSGKYFWDRSAIGYSGYASTGKSSAAAVSNWLRNTLSYTKGMGVTFLTLAPHDTAQPIDCEMFNWGSWSVWSEWSDCADGTQTRTRSKTRSAKTPAANGGVACPTDLEKTETETQSCEGPADCPSENREDGADTTQCGDCLSGFTEDDTGVCVADSTDDDTEETSEEDPATTDDSSTTGEGVTNITAQSTTVTPVAPSSNMNYSPIIALTLIGGAGYLYKKRKDSKSKA